MKYIASPWKRTIIASGGALLGIIPAPPKNTMLNELADLLQYSYSWI